MLWLLLICGIWVSEQMLQLRKFGIDILDASGHIKLKLRGGQRQLYTWQEVSARAPTYFITISEGQTLKNFQKNVFQTSSNVSAAETDNSDTLRKLARNVSELTMPALQM